MPFKSKAQQRWMFAAESRGEVPKGTAREWAHKTKDIKKLPEHVKKTASSIATEVLSKLSSGAPVPVSMTTRAPKASPVPHAATAQAPPQAGDELMPAATQKSAATLSPSGGGPNPTQMRGPQQTQPNQLQANLTSGSTLGLTTPPPPAGPGPEQFGKSPTPIKPASISGVTKGQQINKAAEFDPFMRPKIADEVDPQVKEEVKNFLRHTPNPDDPQVHSWAEANNYDKEKVEDAMYQLATERVKMSSCVLDQMRKLAYVKLAAERIPGGKAEGKPKSDFKPSEVAHARKVEKEHSPDPEVQEEIGRDHDVENPRYYADWLLPMEKIMEKHPKSSLWDYVKLKNK